MYKKLLRFGFYLFYNQFAFTYDLVAKTVSLGQWPAWRKTALAYLQVEGPLLELAYGTGALYTHMVQQNLQPVGIDLSPYMARITRKKLRQNNLQGKIIQAQAQKLPFPTNYFANIVATFPTNYIFQPQTLTEVHRVLQNKAGSRLIVVWAGRLQASRVVAESIEGLYRITGQTSPPLTNLLTVFEQTGFKAEWRIHPLQKSSVTLLIAEKRQAFEQPFAPPAVLP